QLPDDPENNAVLDLASGYWGVESKTLSDNLISQLTPVQRGKEREIQTKALNLAQAQAARDAISKFVYGKLFEWLVDRCNENLRGGAPLKADAKESDVRPPDAKYSIGLLDIFGFEIFESGNSLEQLCINFTNERLQAQFNNHTFTEEQKIYKNE